MGFFGNSWHGQNHMNHFPSGAWTYAHFKKNFVVNWFSKIEQLGIRSFLKIYCFWSSWLLNRSLSSEIIILKLNQDEEMKLMISWPFFLILVHHWVSKVKLIHINLNLDEIMKAVLLVRNWVAFCLWACPLGVFLH